MVHVAGTNGKGSFLAFTRAIAEALGKGVHVYTSPHLVNFHERIVLAGPHGSAPIAEELLVDCLARAEAANGGELITLFEITTAAAFLAFSETPADLVLLETGLGGRLDATNVVSKPLLTAITPISIDHVSFLGETLAEIAGEKAGILKPGVPCVVGRQVQEAFEVIERRAEQVGAPLHVAGRDFDMYEQHGRLVFQTQDAAHRSAAAAPQRAPSDRQCRHGDRRREPHLRRCARPPARSSTGSPMPNGRRGWSASPWAVCTPTLPTAPRSGSTAATTPPAARSSRIRWPSLTSACRARVHLIYGMMETKDAHAFIAPFKGLVERIYTVPIPDEPNAFAAEALAEIAKAEGFDVVPTASLPDALTRSQAALGGPGRVLICGSLYLAGHVLKLHG